VTPGHAHEVPLLPVLLEGGAVHRPQGRPRIRPQRVVGDKAYTGQPTRRYLRRRHIGAVIPRRQNETQGGVRFARLVTTWGTHVGSIGAGWSIDSVTPVR
jgi:transposase